MSGVCLHLPFLLKRMKVTDIKGRFCLTLTLGMVAFLFWRCCFPYLLTYKEQCQLFLHSYDYFCLRLSLPGGLSRYVGEALVQLYYWPTAGAVIVAALLMVVQRLSWRLSGRLYTLSFLPAVLLCYAMSNADLLPTYTVALLTNMAAALVKPGKGGWHWLYVLTVTPLLYWATGPMVLLFSLLTLPLSALWAVACMLASSLVVPYPPSWLWYGLDYCRYPETMLPIMLILPTVILLLSWTARWLHEGWLWTGISTTLVGGVLLACLLEGFGHERLAPIAYDQLVRNEDWDGIIHLAEKHHPDQPQTVCALNLALAVTGQMGERLFDFYQRGSEGLFPPFEHNSLKAAMTGEVYYRLGLVNIAQRFAFEAQEELYSQSGRMMKRLVETNLINGQYDVARKYLHLLQQSLCYRQWAEETMALLDSEDRINSHPVYGRMRQYLWPDDFVFSDDEADKFCGELFVCNPRNTMAMQYLLAAPLLNRDVNRFMEYFGVVQQVAMYNPTVCQQAVIFAYNQAHQEVPQQLVSPMVLQQFDEFVDDYTRYGADSPAMKRHWNTVWRYLTIGE